MKNQPSEPILLCGRYFATTELLEIQETVHMFFNLSRRELAQTICENLNWLTPLGQYKTISCLQLLEKLEGWGLITLPAKRKRKSPGEKRITLSPSSAPALPVRGSLSEHQPITLEPVGKGTGFNLWNEYVQRYHTLGYKRPFGAHQRYFIVSGHGQKLGCLLFAAAAWSLTDRDEWIGWTPEDRKLRVNLIVNNTRFLIFPWVQLKNLASKALSLVVKRIQGDWVERYGYSPVLLETFVDPTKYQGTCYLAANWIYLGKTAGRGRTEMHGIQRYSRKAIYVYPLVADFRAHLKGEIGHERI